MCIRLLSRSALGALMAIIIGNVLTTPALGVGTITEFDIPTPMSQTFDIAPGPDGNLWFSEYGTNKIGRITTGGVITEFDVPTAGSGPARIVTGSVRNLWFTE